MVVNTIEALFELQACRQYRLAGNEKTNQEIYDYFLTMQNNEFKKQSHYFHGRYENLYIDEQVIPGLESLLIQIRTHIAGLLQQQPEAFKFGFWLNAMGPGHVTTRHNHDDDDELVSGVYYIHVPENSGKLRVFFDQIEEITPSAGKMILFSPRLDHEVGMNESNELRLSIGFNAG